MQQEIQSEDGKSVFKIERDGRIRLLLQPQDRMIIIGQLSADRSIVTFSKRYAAYGHGNFELCVPKEIIDNVESAETIALYFRDTQRYFVTSRSTLLLHGHIQFDRVDKAQQLYVYLPHEYWTECITSDEVVHFLEDEKGYRTAQL